MGSVLPHTCMHIQHVYRVRLVIWKRETVSWMALLAAKEHSAPGKQRLQARHLCAPLQYGAVMIVDPEEEFYPEEVAKLADDVRRRGLGLLVFGEWYNTDVQAKMRFFDDNTRSWWTPITGGERRPGAAGGTLCILMYRSAMQCGA